MSLIPKIANQPLMLTWDYVEVLTSSDIKTLEKKAEDFSGQPGISEQQIAAGNVAVIPVSGPLSQKSDFWSWLFSGTSYEGIRRDFRVAMEDNQIDTIVFEIDSPGGEVAGVFDLVDEIYAARTKKRIIAVINETAYSAAYAIASAASEVYLPRTGGAGSIGVIAVHVDQSKYNEKLGVKYTPIYAGKRKNDFSAHEPLSDTAYDVVKAEIDDVYEIFVETVARNRKMNASKIKKMEAGIYQGLRAVEAGLADEVMTFDDVINIKKLGGVNMNLFEMLTETLKDAKPDETIKAMGDLGYVRKEGMLSKEEHEAAINEQTKSFEIKLAESIKAAKTEGKDEAKKETVSILELCSVGGMEQLGLKMVSEGVTEAEARKQILDAKVTGTQKIINSTVNPLNTGEISPLIADAEKRAKELSNS